MELCWAIPLVFFAGGMTFLFPLTAVFLNLFSRKKTDQIQYGQNFSIDVLIPAYNEEDVIAVTIESVRKAVARLSKEMPNVRSKIIVNLDGPKDRTAEIVNKFADITVLNRGKNLGKWATLEELALRSEANWSAMIDCGTLWPEDFLVKLIKNIATDDAIGFGPGYFQEKSGALEKLVWWQERVLKKIENLAGGPITLHGATMVFRTDILKKCFAVLHGYNWFNDDVVLGLTARKYGKINYLGSSLRISDCGFKRDAKEYNRRKRMLLGNVQWIKKLFPSLLFGYPAIAALALRRIFLVFWIYCLLGAMFSGVMLLGAPAV